MEEEAFAVPALPDTLIPAPSLIVILRTPPHTVPALLDTIISAPLLIAIPELCVTLPTFPYFFHYFGKLLRQSVHTRPVQKKKNSVQKQK